MGEKTYAEVFVQGVKDHLDGTPNAHHPVQFKTLTVTVSGPGEGTFAVCTLCGAMVPDDDGWRDLHRKNHDNHNRVHAHIERAANSYTPEPRSR